MKTGWTRFNSIFSVTPLALFFLAIALVGCETTGEKVPKPAAEAKSKTSSEKKRDKELSAIRLHLEVNADGTRYNSPVPVYRQKPVMVNVNTDPFLDERDLLEAAVVETVGGFAVAIQFDSHGQLVLDSVTASMRGNRLAILGSYGDEKDGLTRWLAAPRISRRIDDGVITFTPDSTREEAERWVNGLNNVAKKMKKQSSKAPAKK